VRRRAHLPFCKSDHQRKPTGFQPLQDIEDQEEEREERRAGGSEVQRRGLARHQRGLHLLIKWVIVLKVLRGLKNPQATP
jgi:hypothetical protein